MRIVVPFIGDLEGSDLRLVQLIEFLGIPYETYGLPSGADRVQSLLRPNRDENSCLVVNPRVVKRWLDMAGAPITSALSLFSAFQRLFVHGIRADPFDNALLSAISGKRVHFVHRIDETSHLYEIPAESQDVCSEFAGLSFGPVNPVNDCVFSICDGGPELRSLISIGGRPFMACLRKECTEVLIVCSEDVIELKREIDDSLARYFSQFVPHAMALRYVAGKACWQPSHGSATIIVDDPVLWDRYGFLHFDALHRLVVEHEFHTSIAFIPHNFRRNSARITQMFLENPERLSICFHGNDHTAAEFASPDVSFLNKSLRIADERMNCHRKLTGLSCDRVMVFPQGNFSVEAMRALKSNNFYAAVNTIPHPTDQPVRLSIAELAQPAVLRYGGFSLFSRKPVRQIECFDIAFNIFFGRPVLIVEHHDVFQYPEILVEFANKIRAIAPEVRWANLSTAVSNAFLTRIMPDGTHCVRAYSGLVHISNDSDAVRRYSVEWENHWSDVPIEHVAMDGVPCPAVEIGDTGIRVSEEIPPRTARTFSVVYRNVHDSLEGLGLGWAIRAFIRRRLSEFRDNYLSKNQHVLRAAKALQRRFL